MAEPLSELRAGSGAGLQEADQPDSGPGGAGRNGNGAHPAHVATTLGSGALGSGALGSAALVEGYDGLRLGNRLSPEELRRQVDALSLEQALIDFERANARVLDLTARLVESQKRVLDVQAEAEQLRAEIAALREAVAGADARMNEILGSRAYKWSSRMVAIRNALKG